MAAQRAHQLLELGQQALMRLEVVVRLGQVDAAPAIHRHPVRRVRQVLGRDPEVDGVLGDVVEREPGREPRSTAPEDIPVGLTEHLNVPERQLRVGVAPVIVVDS